MHDLYSVADLRAIERAAQANLPPAALMQRAAHAAAKFALTLVPNPRGDAKVLVLAGPGNNGGDALETAYRLDQAGLQVTVVLYGEPSKQPQDAQQALARMQTSSAQFVDPVFLPDIASMRWTLVIDGLFGIGLTRQISGDLRSMVEYINTLSCPVLSLDVPSGLDADTGNIVGSHGIAVRASHTMTFIADKAGLHTCYGRDYAGNVQIAALDLDRTYFPVAHTHLNDVKLFAGALRRRLHNSHKGSFGDVAVIGGTLGMVGAPILAARTAAKCGAGRVFVAFASDGDPAPAYDGMQPELMFRCARNIDYASATLVVGPGLGTARSAHDFLARALNAATPLVLDADALNLIALEPGLQQKLARRPSASVLTPHPLEAARLLGTDTATIQGDRLHAARTLARQFNAVVVLKGSGTVIARADGKAVINSTGNPALATAGAGDVLAGLCGALLAQHWPAWETALAAVWLHGHAADVQVEQGTGPIGLTASELIPVLRSALNRLTNDHAR